MKRKQLIYLFIVMCALQFVTAQNYIPTVAAKNSTYVVNVAEKSLVFSPKADKRTVAISSDVDILLDSGADWCKVSKKKSFVIVTVKANKSVNERTTIVNLKLKNGQTKP